MDKSKIDSILLSQHEVLETQELSKSRQVEDQNDGDDDHFFQQLKLVHNDIYLREHMIPYNTCMQSYVSPLSLSFTSSASSSDYQDDAAERLSEGLVLYDPKDLETPEMNLNKHHQSYQFTLAYLHDDTVENNQDQEEHPELEPANTGSHSDKRQYVVNEIYTTEVTYVNGIRTLHDYYIVPLEEQQHPIMEDAQIAVFFNNLRQLMLLNSKLLNDLRVIFDDRESNINSNIDNNAIEREGIGALFCRYAPLFKLYAGYAKDYGEVTKLLHLYASDNDTKNNFADFIASCRASSDATHKSFESLLILPIQRIPRYKLLLERIVACTPSGHSDELCLQKALDRVTEVAALLNETVRNHEHILAVLQTQTQFVGQLSLFTSERRLIKAGKLTKMSTRRKEEVMIHLFNDILLYSAMTLTGGFRVRRVVYLNSKAVGVRAGAPKSYNILLSQMSSSKQLSIGCGFVITSLEKSFILFASTPGDQKQWVDAISLAISKAQELNGNGGGLSYEFGPSDAAALWIPDAVVESCTICQSNFKLYFRRHHCRRCGAVVCGNCSSKRSILFMANSLREERVCTLCYKVLDLVKKIAHHWHQRLVVKCGILRRKSDVGEKWTDVHLELIKTGVLRQYSLTATNTKKNLEQELRVTGAIVIHHIDRLNGEKNLYCFQISNYSESDIITQSKMDAHTRGEHISYPKHSPLKSVINQCVSEWDSLNFNSSDSNLSSCQGWVLCATSYQEESAWSHAIQQIADRALRRERKSQIIDNLLFTCNSADSIHLNHLPTSPTLSLSCSSWDYEDISKCERTRKQILKEIVRSEKSYVTCLGECIRLYVQPLMLRQLEGQRILRQRQNQRKRSLLRSAVVSNTLRLSLRGEHRTLSHNSINTSPKGLTIKKTMRKVSETPPSINPLQTSNGVLNGTHTIQSKVLVLDADMAIFFSSIDQICTLNQQFLEHLGRHMEETATQENVIRKVYRPGAIFNAYAPLFQLYTSYASRYDAALRAISTTQFSNFLKEIPEDATADRLRRYLSMPMERIPRYKVFLGELMAVTSVDHVDYNPLRSALYHVNNVTSKIQDIIEQQENTRKVLEVSRVVGIDLRGKKYIKDGILHKVCRSRVQKYYFVLLENAFLYGRHGNGLQKKKFRLIDNLGECKLKENWSDETSQFSDVFNSFAASTILKTSTHAFCFYSSQKSFILLAKSSAEKDDWMKSIQECITKTLLTSKNSDIRRPSLRSQFLAVDNDNLSGSGVYGDYDRIGLANSSTFVIKNGWLNVSTNNEEGERKRQWVTLTQRSITFASCKSECLQEELIQLDKCESVSPMANDQSIVLKAAYSDASVTEYKQQTYYLESSNRNEREEWLRALLHCIQNIINPEDTVNRLQCSRHTRMAPIFMFDKLSSVCMICLQSFAVYRPRHHCRLCGALVCGNCSNRKWTLNYRASKKASRVCDTCTDTALYKKTSQSYVHDITIR